MRWKRFFLWNAFFRFTSDNRKDQLIQVDRNGHYNSSSSLIYLFQVTAMPTFIFLKNKEKVKTQFSLAKYHFYSAPLLATCFPGQNLSLTQRHFQFISHSGCRPHRSQHWQAEGDCCRAQVKSPPSKLICSKTTYHDRQQYFFWLPD